MFTIRYNIQLDDYESAREIKKKQQEIQTVFLVSYDFPSKLNLSLGYQTS